MLPIKFKSFELLLPSLLSLLFKPFLVKLQLGVERDLKLMKAMQSTNRFLWTDHQPNINLWIALQIQP